MPRPLRFEDIAEAKRHLLDDPAAHRRAVRRANDAALLNGLVRVPPPAPARQAVSLTRHQTGFRDQGSRGTCCAFAACAAVEAAYKRAHGVEIDLSEQFAFHVHKAGELRPDYASTGTHPENNSSYWGFQGCSDIVDKLARTALPEESLAPYLDGWAMDLLRHATPASGSLGPGCVQEEVDAFEYLEAHVPTRARRSARFRVTGFAALPDSPSPAQVEAVLAEGHEVVADLPGHCLLLVGYDRARRVYTVKNSWGEGEFLELSYDSADWPVIGGRYVTAVQPPDAAPQWDAFWIGRWRMDHDGWRGDLVIRRTTDYRSDPHAPTKLGDYYRNGQAYDVNGVTTQNGQGLHFWVADLPGRLPPGTPAGQEFRAYVFGGDPDSAAGWTTWNGTPFGLSLGRAALPGAPAQGFTAPDWAGVWEMNHDGVRGRLDIVSAHPFAAVYTTEDGQALRASGGPHGSRPHILDLAVPLPGGSRRFRLLAHTWARGVFSGHTSAGGVDLGVRGHRL
ncbi:hypothetical protein GCM10010232_39190 [Streptomyces amakusaensis]|uniref:Peptidase C1A papain C-terminal domain-containing protein n=1 Tax=Streptomyces amakusaensis TaxID=67271 RepID=A0ABW0AJI3_9ACTN